MLITDKQLSKVENKYHGSETLSCVYTHYTHLKLDVPVFYRSFSIQDYEIYDHQTYMNSVISLNLSFNKIFKSNIINNIRSQDIGILLSV